MWTLVNIINYLKTESSFTRSVRYPSVQGTILKKKKNPTLCNKVYDLVAQKEKPTNLFHSSFLIFLYHG
jgi:hypothetical protein